MTIEEKKLKIKEYCNSIKACAYCKLCDVELNCFNVVKYGSDEEVEKLYNILTHGTPYVTRNLSNISDRFFCEKCRIYLENWMKCLNYEDGEDTHCCEYEFKFCPECGRKVVEE